MTTNLTRVAIFAVLCLASGTAHVAFAEGPQIRLNVSPPFAGPRLVAPRPAFQIGFSAHFEPACGMIVDHVQPGTPAWRMGLERGDEIRSLNGRRVRSAGEFYAQLAQTHPNPVFLVLDVRTGRQVVRVAHLNQRPHDQHHDHHHHYGHNHGPNRLPAWQRSLADNY